MFVFVEDEGVGVVVDDDDVVAAGEVNNLFVELACGSSSCGHVGVVCPHELDSAEVHGFELVEVGLPSVGFEQVVVDNLLAEDFAEGSVSGVSGVGHKHFVAWVAEGECDMQYAFLASYERLYLCGWVEFDVVPTLVEVGHGLAKFGYADCGLVAVCIGFARVVAEYLYGLFAWRHVGGTNGERYDVFALSVKLCYFFEFAREVVFGY